MSKKKTVTLRKDKKSRKAKNPWEITATNPEYLKFDHEAALTAFNTTSVNSNSDYRLASTEVQLGLLPTCIVVIKRYAPTFTYTCYGAIPPDKLVKEIYIAKGDEIVLHKTVNGHVEPARTIQSEYVFDDED